jgi:hypothetical protein
VELARQGESAVLLLGVSADVPVRRYVAAMEASSRLSEQYVFGCRDTVAVGLGFSDEAACASCPRTARDAEAISVSAEVMEETAHPRDSASRRTGQEYHLSCNFCG